MRDDRDLVNAFHQGDRVAARVLYDRYKVALLGYAQSMLGSRDLAEEVVQEVFLAFIKGAAKNFAGKSFKNYLFASARNKAIDRKRRDDSRQKFLLNRGGPLLEASVEDEGREDAPMREEVQSMLESLPDEQREVLTLKFYAGHTLAEIAEILDLPPGTVTSRYENAKERLRMRMNRG